VSFAFLKSCNPQWSRAEAGSRDRTKVCVTCDERKPVGEFYEKTNSKGNVTLHSSCKACMKIRVQLSRRA